MESETVTEVTEPTNNDQRTIGMDGTSFSKGPSKPVPLQPRPRARANSTTDENDKKSLKSSINERNSAPPSITVEEVDTPGTTTDTKCETKDKRSSLDSLKRFFKKSGSKSGKKGNNDTIIEADEK